MAAPIHITQCWDTGQYDMVIDVRSPAEFADDHITGAINLPSLSDAERAAVGTLYKQESAFEARKLGSGLMMRNIAHHLDNVLKDKPVSFSPLIHCWRGGQRSRAFAVVLSEIGWTTYLLEGGYKAYRRDILDKLKFIPSQLKLFAIAGRTGSGKTALLQHLAKNGAQVLDLEDLAAHRGSLLGHIPDRPQPAQRLFESRSVDVLFKFQLERPVFVEAESSRIGNLQIPSALWRELTCAPMITINVPLNARAAYLTSVYEHLTVDPTDIARLIDGMIRRHGHDVTDGWRTLVESKNWHQLSESLLRSHYDPAYDYSVKCHNRKECLTIQQADCSQAELEKTAVQILSLIEPATVNK